MRIRKLPDSTLKDLVKERRAFLVRLESLLELQKADLIEANRFKSGEMNLGTGPRRRVPGVGDVILVTLAKHSAPQLGVIQSISGGACSIRRRKDALITTLATVTPVTVGGAEHKDKMSKIGARSRDHKPLKRSKSFKKI